MNIVILFLLVTWGCFDWQDILERLKIVLKPVSIVCFAFGVFIMTAPQFICWKIMTGKFLVRSYSANETFSWLKPHISEVLFSINKGMLFWAPVLVLSFIGILLYKNGFKEYGTFIGVLVVLGAHFYITCAWDCWTYGGSFGQRPFVDFYALYGFLMAATLQICRDTLIPLRKRINNRECVKMVEGSFPIIGALYPFIGVCIFFEMKAMLAYWYGILPFEGATLDTISAILNWTLP